MKFWLDSVPTPIGEVLIVSDGTHVRALYFEDYRDGMNEYLRRTYGTDETSPANDPGGASSLVSAYFRGEVTALDQIAAHAQGTAFQKCVWQELRNIPAGETLSYGQLALRIGRPSASRAVGLANGSNPVSLVLPCHRVIGSNGSLTGYGGGLERKRWLLTHERALAGHQLSLP